MGISFKLLAKSFLIGLALCLACWAETPQEVWKKVKGGSLEHRMEAFSGLFIGTPFLDAPLGEGPKSRYDSNPRYRFDGFDCTTYVETTLALALAPKPADFEKTLDRIRYRGPVGFLNRNHFPCVDWIPHNTAQGRIRDITLEVGSFWKAEFATSPIDKRSWVNHLTSSAVRMESLTEGEREKRLTELKAKASKFQPQTPNVPYIPLDQITQRKEITAAEKARRLKEEESLITHLRTAPGEPLTEEAIHTALIDLRLRHLIEDVTIDPRFLDNVPNASILNVVRPGWKIPGTVINISHQGFVFRKNGVPYFRHVSKTGKRAKDVLLANYLRLCLLIPSIKGVNLLGVSNR